MLNFSAKVENVFVNTPHKIDKLSIQKINNIVYTHLLRFRENDIKFRDLALLTIDI